MTVEPIIRTAKVEPPIGYTKIQGDHLCRCLRMVRMADGTNWCCNAKPMLVPITENSPPVDDKIVELVTAPEQAAALKEKLEHALHDVCAVLDQIDSAGLHGSFQLGKGQYWNVASMTVAKHF